MGVLPSSLLCPLLFLYNCWIQAIACHFVLTGLKISANVAASDALRIALIQNGVDIVPLVWEVCTIRCVFNIIVESSV